MNVEPAQAPDAPKRDIARVHAALRLFGRDREEYERDPRSPVPPLISEFRLTPIDRRSAASIPTEVKTTGIPISTEFVNRLIDLVAAEYRRRLDVKLRRSQIEAFSKAIAAATGHANALEALAGSVPGYMSHEILKRRPDGGRNDVAIIGVPLPGATQAPKGDDANIAFGPEIALPYERRPDHILRPTIERARALARLLTEQRKTLEGDLLGRGGGRQNVERDGRNARDTLSEACYLLVAGCFGPPGIAKIVSTDVGVEGGAERAPPFHRLLAEMHRYATGDAIEPKAFNRTASNIVPAMQAELETCGAWNFWIMLYSEPTARPMVGMVMLAFLSRLINPAARPPARSAS